MTNKLPDLENTHDDGNAVPVRIVSYPQSNKPHILSTSANLMGICFVIITGLRITNRAAKTCADEICLGAAFCFLVSCFFSYLSLRSTKETKLPWEVWADYGFLAGITGLFVAVCILTVEW